MLLNALLVLCYWSHRVTETATNHCSRTKPSPIAHTIGKMVQIVWWRSVQVFNCGRPRTSWKKSRLKEANGTVWKTFTAVIKPTQQNCIHYLSVLTVVVEACKIALSNRRKFYLQIKLCPREAQTCARPLFCNCDLDIEPMTLQLHHDLAILKLYFYTESIAAR